MSNWKKPKWDDDPQWKTLPWNIRRGVADSVTILASLTGIDVTKLPALSMGNAIGPTQISQPSLSVV